MGECPHDFTEHQKAWADGICPLCLAAVNADLLAALEAVESQCGGHADEFSGNVARIARAAIARAEVGE